MLRQAQRPRQTQVTKLSLAVVELVETPAVGKNLMMVASTGSATTSSMTTSSMTEARTRKLIFSIGTLQWLSLSKPPALLAFSCGRFDASTSSATTGSMTEARTRKLIFSIGTLRWLSVSKPLASLAFSGGRFDKLNDHRLNDRSQDTEIDFQYWYSLVAERVEATSFVSFFWWSFRQAQRPQAQRPPASVISTGSMTEARTRKLIFSIGILQWLSLSKPPALLAFSGGRFDKLNDHRLSDHQLRSFRQAQ